MAHYYKAINGEFYVTNTTDNEDFRDNVFTLILNKLISTQQRKATDAISGLKRQELLKLLEFVSDFEFENGKTYKIQYEEIFFELITEYLVLEEGPQMHIMNR